jgi:hypothetical protein
MCPDSRAMVAQPSSLTGQPSSMLQHVEHTRGAVICSILPTLPRCPHPTKHNLMPYKRQFCCPDDPRNPFPSNPFPTCYTALCEASCPPCFAYRSNNDHLHPEQGRHLAPPYRHLRTARPRELQLHANSNQTKNGGSPHAPILSVNPIGTHTHAHTRTHTYLAFRARRVASLHLLFSWIVLSVRPLALPLLIPLRLRFPQKAQQYAVSISEK